MAFGGYYPQYPAIAPTGAYAGRGMSQFDYGQTQQAQLRGRLVSSMDEARAAQVDFDGSTFFFPDMAHKRIYTKQILMDGTASINTYVLTEEPEPKQQTYVTHDEFEHAMSDIRKMMGANADATNAKSAAADDQLSTF